VTDADDLTPALEAVLVDLARDPGEAVWRPGWEQSPAVKAMLVALVDRVSEAVCGVAVGGPWKCATRPDPGPMLASDIRDALVALDELRRLMERAALERAATVLALFRAAGLRVGVAGGRLTLGPRDRVTAEHTAMAREWRAELVKILERVEEPAGLAAVG
jgi:hypothetical protein